MTQQKASTVQEIAQQSHQGITWLDIEHPSQEMFRKLETEYKLHPVHLNESVQKIQHNQVERESNYLFLVLHVPVFDSVEDKILVNQVAIFIGATFFITIRTGACPAVQDLFTACKTQHAQADRSFGKSTQFLLYSVITGILRDISRMTDEVENELDAIEDLVFDNKGSDAQRIGRVRQKIVKLRRTIGPKRFVLQDLAEQVSDKTMTKHYANNTKTVNKLWEVIEEAKETVEIYKDADFTTSTEQTNEILAVLTIIFTFTIPITVVGTLYGMNVPLPGGIEAGSWTFLGSFTTFGLILAGAALLAALMYFYFRKKQWF